MRHGINILAVASALFVTGCATYINSYPVAEDGSNRKGGIPFYIPKPILQVKESIEIGREERIYAVISVSGMDEFLYPIDVSNFSDSKERLKKLLGMTGGEIHLEAKKTSPTFLSHRNVKESEHKEFTEKYSTMPSSDSKEDKTTGEVIYKSSDLDKSISVIYLPDYTKEYELLVSPTWFASTNTTITLTDGWKLASVNATDGENQVITALKDVVTGAITANKDVKVAEITKDQALKLKELEAQTSESGEKEMAFDVVDKHYVSIKGYVKEVRSKVIKPGLYNLKELLSTDATNFSLPVIESSQYKKIDL